MRGLRTAVRSPILGRTFRQVRLPRTRPRTRCVPSLNAAMLRAACHVGSGPDNGLLDAAGMVDARERFFRAPGAGHRARPER